MALHLIAIASLGLISISQCNIIILILRCQSMSTDPLLLIKLHINHAIILVLILETLYVIISVYDHKLPASANPELFPFSCQKSNKPTRYATYSTFILIWHCIYKYRAGFCTAAETGQLPYQINKRTIYFFIVKQNLSCYHNKTHTRTYLHSFSYAPLRINGMCKC